MEFRSPLTTQIASFLREIGIEVRSGSLDHPTFMAGMDIEKGVLVIDENRLIHPGDLLHEAGHLAIIPSSRRRELSGNVESEPHEEMMAIAWSWAALTHLGLDPAIVFHADGYQGGGQSIIENFREGRYFAVCSLQWMGLTAEPPKAAELGVAPYPHMLSWLAE